MTTKQTGHMKGMKTFKIEYADQTQKIVLGRNSLAVIKEYDLASRKHINTRITELPEISLSLGDYKPELDIHWEEPR